MGGVRQSFQGVNTVEEMAARALGGISSHQRLSKRVRDGAKQFLSSTRATATVEGVTFTLSPAFRSDPVATLETALSDVSRALRDDRMLLAWDEIPDMVLDIAQYQGVDAAARLLKLLRRFRDEAPRPGIRWLLTGSVGFHHALRRMDSGDAMVNDLDSLPLGPLNEPWAEWLSASLLARAGVSADGAAAEEVARVSGGIPYLAHLVAKEARDRRLRVLPARDVEPLFDQAANDLDQSQQATHFLSRLGTYYGSSSSAAEWILDQIARRVSTRSELEAIARQSMRKLGPDCLGELLDSLCLDHYLVKHPTSPPRYDWRYPPLARIWQIRRA